MASLDYRLNPIYTIKECSSCGALYNKSCCCSKGGFVDKFVRDPNKTPYSSQRPPHKCPKCGNPADGLYCRQCALLRKKLKEVWFTICDENEIFQDFLNTSESSNNNTNVVNAPQEPFVFNQDPSENSSQSPSHIDHHCCYGCGDSLRVLIISNSKPCYNQNVDEFPQTLPSFHSTCYSGDENSFTYDSNLKFMDDYPNPPPQPLMYSYEFCGDDAYYGCDCPPQEPKDSLIIGDEHLDNIPEKEPDDFIKHSVKNLVPNPSESKDLSNIGSEYDVPVCDDFTNFSNYLFDADKFFSSSDDASFSDEDIPKEIYSNPLFDEEIISFKINPHHFNADSDLIESFLNRDTSIVSSPKFDSLLEEFSGELIFLKATPPGIDEADCDPEEDIHLVERLLYNNSSPRPPEEFNSKNSNDVIESFSPSPIPVEDSDSLKGPLTAKVVGNISECYVYVPNVLPTQTTLCPVIDTLLPFSSENEDKVFNLGILASKEEKSPHLLSHRGFKAFQLISESPMIIYGGNIF
nr:hypothetical protein [Tanacetum cinerariifolium]